MAVSRHHSIALGSDWHYPKPPSCERPWWQPTRGTFRRSCEAYCEWGDEGGHSYRRGGLSFMYAYGRLRYLRTALILVSQYRRAPRQGRCLHLVGHNLTRRLKRCFLQQLGNSSRVCHAKPLDILDPPSVLAEHDADNEADRFGSKAQHWSANTCLPTLRERFTCSSWSEYPRKS